MIELFLLAALQAPAAERIAFACQDDKGETFVLYAPAMLEEGYDPQPTDYVVERLNVEGAPDQVFDDLPEDLELNWRPEGEPQVRLEIKDYDVIGRTASYRLHRESPPGQAISWSSFSSGQCLGRRIADAAAGAPQEGNAR